MCLDHRMRLYLKKQQWQTNKKPQTKTNRHSKSDTILRFPLSCFVCMSFLAGEEQDQIENIFSFLIPLGKLRLWGVWKDGYLLKAFLGSWLTCNFLLFSELCQHLPQRRALVWKLSTSVALPILDSFSSGQGYILFLFVSVGGGEKGGTEELLTASPCLDSSALEVSLALFWWRWLCCTGI